MSRNSRLLVGIIVVACFLKPTGRASEISLWAQGALAMSRFMPPPLLDSVEVDFGGSLIALRCCRCRFDLGAELMPLLSLSARNLEVWSTFPSGRPSPASLSVQ